MKAILGPTSALAFAALLSACPSNDNPEVDAGGGKTPDAGLCGNGTCNSGESTQTCPADCPAPVCGDDICADGETPQSCAKDCGAACGNNTCEEGETITSCPADCHAVCGNHVCEPGETGASCAADCPIGSCVVGDPNSCANSDNVCVNSTCVPAFSRNYKIKITGGVFPEKLPDNSFWDEPLPFTSVHLPDGKATLDINGTTFTTPTINNVLTPTWNYLTGLVLIPAGTRFELTLFDADNPAVGDADDVGVHCVINPLDANTIRHGVKCNGIQVPLANVSLTFLPQ